MKAKLLSTLTERGQVSIPALLRRLLKLRPGQVLEWQKISSQELRIIVAPRDKAPGALTALGYAEHFAPKKRRTEEVLRELRAGEDE